MKDKVEELNTNQQSLRICSGMYTNINIVPVNYTQHILRR